FFHAQRLCLGEVLTQGEAETLEVRNPFAVRQTLERFGVRRILEPVMPLRADDLTAEVDRGSDAVLLEEVEELGVSAMSVVERHDKWTSGKLTPLLASERIDELVQRDQVVSLDQKSKVLLEHVGLWIVVDEDRDAVSRNRVPEERRQTAPSNEP